jgi:hypothetical protein
MAWRNVEGFAEAWNAVRALGRERLGEKREV